MHTIVFKKIMIEGSITEVMIEVRMCKKKSKHRDVICSNDSISL